MSDSRNKNTENKTERRRALKALTAGGALAGVSSLPQRWTKPAIDSIVLPVHAQTTDASGSLPGEEPATTVAPTTTTDPCPVNCDININLNWSWANTSQDFDLEVETPGGTRIAPNGAAQGRCLEIKSHDGIVQSGHGRIANITPGKVAEGRYQIFANVGNGQTVSANLLVNVCANTYQTNFSFSNTGIYTLGSFDVSPSGAATFRIN